MKRRDLARQRILFFADRKRRRSPPDVVGRVRTALPFWQGLDGRFPRVGTHARGVIHRKTEVIAQRGSGHPLGLIFVEARRPLARKIDLRERGSGREYTDGEKYA